MQQTLKKPQVKKLSKKEKREALIAKKRWEKIRLENTEEIKKFSVSKRLDTPVIYTLIFLIVGTIGLFYFEFYIESLVGFMVASFVGSTNSLVNHNWSVAKPFLVGLVVSLLLIAVVVFNH